MVRRHCAVCSWTGLRLLPSPTAGPCRVPLPWRLSSCVHCTATPEHLTRRATERPERVARTKRTARQQPLHPRPLGRSGRAGALRRGQSTGKTKQSLAVRSSGMSLSAERNRTVRHRRDSPRQRPWRHRPPPATARRRATQSPVPVRRAGGPTAPSQCTHVALHRKHPRPLDPRVAG